MKFIFGKQRLFYPYAGVFYGDFELLVRASMGSNVDISEPFLIVVKIYVEIRTLPEAD